MTKRLALMAIVGAAAVGITATVAAPATNGVPRLVGVTGPEWTITLK